MARFAIKFVALTTMDEANKGNKLIGSRVRLIDNNRCTGWISSFDSYDSTYMVDGYGWYPERNLEIYSLDRTEQETEMPVLTEERKARFVTQMFSLLKKYGYNPDTNALMSIVDKWWEQKRELIAPFTKLDGWNENKFMFVATEQMYQRNVDTEGAYNFYNWFRRKNRNGEFVKENTILNYSWAEASRIKDSLYNTIILFEKFPSISEIKGMYRRSDIPELEKRYNLFRDTMENTSQYPEGAREKVDALLRYVRELVDNIHSSYDGLVSIDQESMFYRYECNRQFKNRPKVGQKIMRFLMSLFREAGLDKHPEYSEQIAMLGDAINPTEYKRTSIISFNPIDYLTMSFGTSWNSCHTIDKGNRDNRNSETNYHGMHASGTMSYMLDSSSAVFYTVSDSYDASKGYENSEKSFRQMIHMGGYNNPIFAVGRLYPQKNDSAEGNQLREQCRKFMQEVISKAWDIPNFWKTNNSAYNFIKTTSGSTHYPDYEHFDCKVSYVSDMELGHKIVVGARPICIECGNEHTIDGELSCCNDWDSTEGWNR